jgi:hypothetical protein
MYQSRVKSPLVFACIDCKKLSEHSPQDIQVESIEVPHSDRYTLVLWCAEFDCIHEGCGRRFAVYTKQRSNTTVLEIAKAVFSAQPPPSCGSDDNHLMTFPVEPVKTYRVE